MDAAEARRAMKLAKKISRKLHPLFANQGPQIQGAILADLVATWLVGFPKGVRADLLQMHIEYAVRMIPVNEAMLHGDAGHPQNAQQEAGEQPKEDENKKLH
jgi:hypothetical protein